MSAQARARWIYVAMAAFMVAAAAVTSADAVPRQAERFHAPQITETDVSLDNPEVQVVLQSDTFHEMLAEMSFGEALERSVYGPYDEGREAGSLWPPVMSQNADAFNRSEYGPRPGIGGEAGDVMPQAADALQQAYRPFAQALQRVSGYDAQALQQAYRPFAQALQRMSGYDAQALQQAYRPFAQALQRVSGYDAQALQQAYRPAAQALQRISGFDAAAVGG
jgi:hypothetical protein